MLLSQYKTIMKTYLTILGMSNLKLADVNEIILPEIENLLRRYDYNCEFRETGIYSSGEAKFFVQSNKSDNERDIRIKSGENSCTISPSVLEAGPRGLFLSKRIVDLSNLSAKDQESLSKYANIQVSPHNMQGVFFFKFPLKSIDIMSTICEGVELSKVVLESYECSKGPTSDLCIKQTFSIDPHSPTIHYDFDTFGFDCLQVENLTPEEYISYLHDITYTPNAVPFKATENHVELFNSGESGLYYSPYHIIGALEEYGPSCFNIKSSLAELVKNLREYDNKYG